MDYRVIKEGDLFFLTDVHGDVTGNDEAGHGLYTQDTRFLSRMEMLIDGEKPTLLASEGTKGYFASIRSMKVSKDEGAIEMLRERYIQGGILHERVSLTNFFPGEVRFDFAAAFDADFQDMFIVRKYRTGDVGEIVDRDIGPSGMSIRYRGKDEIERETQVAWDCAEAAQAGPDGCFHFAVSLAPKETKRICFTVTPVIAGKVPEARSFEDGLALLEQSYDSWRAETTGVASDVPAFDEIYRRGVTDVRMLMTDIGYGDVPVAGLPWFAVPFGRDSLITSLFMLPLNAGKVRGTLRTLAATQGEKTDPWRDERPGKIMHEIRFGELVQTGQSPFGPYYGTVDATPLFLVVLGEYVRWTGDAALAEELKPNVLRALAWIDENAGGTEGGFLSYRQEAEKGFPNQGWKDSSNSIVHETGEYASSPIALSEVQGYAYQAKKTLAPIFRLLGDVELADRLEQEAAALQARFEEAYWMEDERFYAIALDEDARQVRSVSSNPGHLLMSGLPERSRAESVARRLVSEDMFNGYGVRTMSTQATGYYPMSYHNGSVWPHDNGMILLGLGKLGLKQEAGRVITGLLDASSHFEYRRLPELFCGYGSSESDGPVPYPTTCSPQAWAAATSFAFVQAMLGIDPNVPERKIALNPFLPEGFGELTVSRLPVGQGHLTVKLVRTPGQDDYGKVRIEVVDNTTGCELQIQE
ncbi:glycogen debranching N-terminal domain-containing protein [Cohnella candidum]|uniref:Amylo-alpha-1,6-glucosidase n=1 Tax=Cohnella candidum TaxID=2674991 RepID=A0A3G3K4J0_9BACL|nr:glycogen debranching N-terminal domain-containing protein [Cohnella candidum]AYQ74967.1 amylo-alpha-1,6-glucosidase [Cohnella candidum]